MTLSFIFSALILSGMMLAAWLMAMRTGSGSWADVFWSYGTGLAGVFLALAPFSAISERQWLVAAIATLWSVRLGTHILTRTMGSPEDPRYAALRREWGDRHRMELFKFLQIQAAASLPLVLAIAIAAHSPAPLGRLQDWLALAVALIALGGEALSDQQLRRFAQNPANKGKVCDQGLWAFSRHPNYVFETLGWCIYPVMVLQLSWWPSIFSLLAPALIYYLLRHVSGVPLLEAHMVRSRGEAYRDYQSRVPVFFPFTRSGL